MQASGKRDAFDAVLGGDPGEGMEPEPKSREGLSLKPQLFKPKRSLKLFYSKSYTKLGT